jgi:hypothetical protein
MSATEVAPMSTPPQNAGGNNAGDEFDWDTSGFADMLKFD